MKRTPLGPGKRSLERGSTFENRGSGLARAAADRQRPTTRRRAISPASPAQREKARHAVSIVSGESGCDPAHLWPRGMGGCDDPLCVVPLTRPEHRAYDDGELDLLPHLIARGCVAELAHALEHARGDLIGLLNRLTAERWVPERKDVAA